jgi:hypothetical protein
VRSFSGPTRSQSEKILERINLRSVSDPARAAADAVAAELSRKNFAVLGSEIPKLALAGSQRTARDSLRYRWVDLRLMTVCYIPRNSSYDREVI